MKKPHRFYAQNFEDLYLYRLFLHIENGFYVDAGAWDPHKDSVTKLFYDNGWCGINIEPLQECYDSLVSHRPRDINLCAAVVKDQSIGAVDLTVIGNNPQHYGIHFLSNGCGDSNKIAFNAELSDTYTRKVAATTLREVIDKYAKPRKINFLKLDIEGSEFDALVGMNLPTLDDELKPDVILLEVTLPCTRISAPHRGKCKELLLANDYAFLYFDGLNDYYCRTHLLPLYSDLMLPPNVFDAIIASNLFNQADACSNFSSKVEILTRELENLAIERDATEKELLKLRAHYSSLEADHTNQVANQKAIFDAIYRTRHLAD